MYVMDLEKTFEHVPLSILSEMLQEYGVSGLLLRTFQSLHSY